MKSDDTILILEQDKNLSSCEKRIMKAIWDATEDITIQELMDTLKNRFEKDYKRTTVMTFLLRLSNKGFLFTYRKGRPAYIHPLKTEMEYMTKTMQEQIDFWFDGDTSHFLSFAAENTIKTQKEKKALQSVLRKMNPEEKPEE